MGFLDFLSPQAWRRAAAQQVVWSDGWPYSSPPRTLKEFWIPESIKIKPVELPFGTVAKKVDPCVDVQFHFDRGRIVIDKAWASQSVGRNCTSQDGESFAVPQNFFPSGVLEAVLQKQADTVRTAIRSRIYAVMVDELEAAGLETPTQRPKRTRRKKPLP
jgi:hypothetical protein